MSGSSSAPQVPAWKRLGLKLKSASDAQDTPLKRKESPAAETTPDSKRVKTNSAASTPTLSRKKSVSFTPETKIEDGDSIKQIFNGWVADQKKQDPNFDFKNTNTNTPLKTVESAEDISAIDEESKAEEKKVKKAKRAKTAKITKSEPKPPPRPFLEYLRQYSESRPTWKFNKNHQNHLLKHAFDVTVIPSDHSHFLYEYIRGLQGGVRFRLRDEALSVKVKDQEAGAEGFAADMPSKEQEQLNYDRAMKEYIATMMSANVSQDIGYEEGVLLGLSNQAMVKRAARRMRSEKILKELAETGTSLTDQKEHVDVERVVDAAPKKMGRKRKRRTDIEDSSSSDSSSSSDTDSSSDSDSDSASEKGSGGSSKRQKSSVAISISSDSSSSDSDSSSSSSSSGSDSE